MHSLDSMHTTWPRLKISRTLGILSQADEATLASLEWRGMEGQGMAGHGMAWHSGVVFYQRNSFRSFTKR